MARRPATTTTAAILLALGCLLLLPSLFTAVAEAKGPIYNAEHNLQQYLKLVLLPMAVAAGVLVMIAVRARQGMQYSRSNNNSNNADAA